MHEALLNQKLHEYKMIINN